MRGNPGLQIGAEPVVEIDEQAHGFLRSLRELGYLDPAVEMEIIDRVTSISHGLARLEEVRRIAAQVLFERHETLLDEEWRALFS